MGSLREVRFRIASVNSTKQITNAMKLVSASKLRRAQNAIVKLRPYASKIKDILQSLSNTFEDSEDNLYYQTREPKNVLLVVVNSNRGLCGAFNANVIKFTNKTISENYSTQKQNGSLSLICIGKKASDYFRKHSDIDMESHDELLNSISFQNISIVAEKLMQSFAEKKYDKIEIIYHQFKNAAVKYLKIEQFLPIQPGEESESEQTFSTGDFIFEPDKDTIVNELIPKSLKIQFYKVLLDSAASEHGARMTAMHKATDNASEMLKELKLTYNKARQAAITSEILEIVSGAEALKG